MTFRSLILFIVISFQLTGCSYLGSAIKQAAYTLQQRRAPTQLALKQMLPAENFFVFGKTVGKNAALNKDAVAIVAVSEQFRKNEIVDVSHFSGLDSYFGLSLPAGDYQLLVVSDLNRDGFYDETETVGGRLLSVGIKELPDKVLGGADIDMEAPFRFYPGTSFRLAVRSSSRLPVSLFFPKGSIRSLDDEIFSPRTASLGTYDPPAFLAVAPTMFYALEEDVGYKVPVIFVHGINGSPRDFKEIISRLDRRFYRPWFFYYPGGNELSQLGETFYDIFLSGNVMHLQDMPVVIVAHSMGGLVARDAMNRYTGRKGEAKTARLITIASPMGGHPGAARAARAPVIVPSWRDIAPESAFIRGLRRKALPDGVDYHLLFAYADSSAIKLGENSDGVVPLSSQLCYEAQAEAKAQYGFNDTHMGILKNPEAIQRVLKIIGEVRPPFPEDHLKELVKGGYTVELGMNYSPMEKYLIGTVGHWMQALASGAIAPLDPAQVHFVKVCRGEKTPGNDAETAWLKFSKEHPAEISRK